MCVVVVSEKGADELMNESECHEVTTWDQKGVMMEEGGEGGGGD